MAGIRELTFGIEIEAVLIYRKDHFPAENFDQNTLRNLIYKQLSEPIRRPCRRARCNKVHEYSLPVYDPSAGDYPDYRKWRPYDDLSVGLTSEQLSSDLWDDLKADYEFHGIEVVSRILNASGKTPDPDGKEDEHGPIMLDIQEEISFVINRLNAFNVTRDFRCFVNATSGMHVHVGAAQASLPLKVPRGIRALFTAFERQIDSILTSNRVGAYVGGMVMPNFTQLTPAYKYPRQADYFEFYGARYCQPESAEWLHRLEETLIGISKAKQRSEEAREAGIYAYNDDGDYEKIDASEIRASEDKETCLAGLVPGRFPYDIILNENDKNDTMRHAVQAYHIPGWLYLLASVRSFKDMDQVASRNLMGHNMIVNLDNLDPKLHHGKGTIEIRCHPGSLDVAEIMAWINTVVSMVEFTLDNTQVHLTKLLLKWSESSFTFADLVRDVGASEQTEAFYRKTLLKEDYANDRRDRMIAQQTHDSPLTPLLALVEADRATERSQSAVQERIRHKLESGLYGKLPYTLVRETLGPTLIRQAETLIIRKQERGTWTKSIMTAASDDDQEDEINKVGRVYSDTDIEW